MARLYSTPSFSTLKVEQFKGCDSSVPEDQMKPYRAARSENMIPGAVGEVRKRPGVHRSEAPGIEIGVGDVVHKMIGGKHPIVYNGTTEVAGYKIYYNRDFILKCYYEPVVIPHGEGWIVFALLNKDDLENWKDDATWQIGGITSDEKFEFFSAMILIDIKESVRVYTDKGMCCTRNDNGTWKSAVIEPDDELLTTPITVNGCDPAGGGSTFQQVNLLNPWVTEGFCCKTEKTSVFYLHDPLPDIGKADDRWMDKETLERYFKVEVLVPIGIQETAGDEASNEKATVLRWIERPFYANGVDQDGYRLSANRIFLDPNGNKSVVEYSEAGKNYAVTVGKEENDYWIDPSPKEGEDNVRITHWRASFTEEFRKLCACVCGTVFGVGGYKDRLFLGGCQTGADGYKEHIFFSEVENPFYIGALDYVKLEGGCRVMALDGTADALAALTDQGIYLIGAQAQGDAEKMVYLADALFTVVNKVMAPAPLHYGDTEVLGGEIVYLSKEGVIAVAYKENFDERFAEHRSAMIDREMLGDDPQQLLSLGRFLLIRCAGGIWWLLDENQPNSEGDKPYSSHQYEGYRMSGMFADVAWVEDDQLKLVLGGDQYYWTDGTAATHYYDAYPTADGLNVAAITAWWETPWLYGSDFYRNKIFMKLGLLLGQVTFNSVGRTVIGDTAVKVEGKKNDEDWTTLWDYDGTLCSFDYLNLDYRLFTYAGAPGIPALNRKIKIKKAKRFKLRFSNDFIDQTFVLRQFGLDYVQED